MSAMRKSRRKPLPLSRAKTSWTTHRCQDSCHAQNEEVKEEEAVVDGEAAPEVAVVDT